MTDTDAVIRDSNSRAKAYIEYKHANIKTIDLNHWQLKGIRSDADDRLTPIPAFVVVYYHLDGNNNPINSTDYDASPISSNEILAKISHQQYYVIALNIVARALLGAEAAMLSAQEYWRLHATILGVPNSHDASSTSTAIVRMPEVRMGQTLLWPGTHFRPSF